MTNSDANQNNDEKESYGILIFVIFMYGMISGVFIYKMVSLCIKCRNDRRELKNRIQENEVEITSVAV